MFSNLRPSGRKRGGSRTLEYRTRVKGEEKKERKKKNLKPNL